MHCPGRALLVSLLAAALPLAACAGPGPSAGSPTPQAPEAAPDPEREDTGDELAPLTGRERELSRQLERDVTHLAVEIGERSSADGWNQAETCDYLAAQFEAAGHTVQRLGYSLEGEETAQNLEVQVAGGTLGYEVVVVGAHYDSAIGSPGANDNASGVAALLALARSLTKVKPSRTVRLVAFANQEAPHTRTPHMGSSVYAKQAMARGDRIAGVIVVESIGYYSDEPDSQQRPGPLQLRLPQVGNFITVVGDQGSAGMAERVLAAFARHASLPVEGGALPDDVSDMGSADTWAFWRVKVPAVLVTDTGRLRYPHHHQKTDTPDRLDFDRMARAVAGLEHVVMSFAEAMRPADDASADEAAAD